MQLAFTVDDTTDHDVASDGLSRYGAYLRQKWALFHVDGPGHPPTQDDVQFAVVAWTIARPPIMAPGYVSDHPRIQNATIHWDDDARAAVAVQIAVPAWPGAYRIPSHWRGWTCPPAALRWTAPYDNDRPTVLTSLTVRIPVAAEELPTPRYRSGAAETAAAKRAVMSLCEIVNTELAGVLTEIDTPLSTSLNTSNVEVPRW